MESTSGKLPPRGPDKGLADTRAFVAVKHGERSWVVDLPPNLTVTIGSAAGSGVFIDADGLSPVHASMRWDGIHLTLDDGGTDSGTFLNGKRMEGAAELKPGDEIALGGAQLVVGIAASATHGGRRALTHHEFRERLWEEMARAARGSRPTTLVMVHARPGDGGKVAGAALDSFRAGDVVGTYAHDELEFLLPDTTAETAQAVVERILAQSGAVGAVAGISVAPQDGDNPERLVRAARNAVTLALRAGQGIAATPPRTPVVAPPEATDPATLEVMARLSEIAKLDDNLLLTGEHSSGKGLFARAVHDRSARTSAPFVMLSCIASTDSGLDASVVQQARGGTLVLDEVADLSDEAQAALLALLRQEAGSCRVIATTQRTLAGLVERGAFNAELHEMLARQIVEIPPLRSRPEDIIPLAQHFAAEFGARTPVQLSPGALARLRSYPWPGNVLELRNAMERAVRLAHGGEILAEHLPSEALPHSTDGRLREHVDSVERDAIIKALADSNHNQTHAAKRLGISRRALIYKMEKYGLKPPPGTARR